MRRCSSGAASEKFIKSFKFIKKMTQDEKWNEKHSAVMAFIQANRRNPSRYDAAERGLYLNWVKHNKKLLKSGELKPERVEKFNQLLSLMEQYRHKNQYA